LNDDYEQFDSNEMEKVFKVEFYNSVICLPRNTSHKDVFWVTFEEMTVEVEKSKNPIGFIEMP